VLLLFGGIPQRLVGAFQRIAARRVAVLRASLNSEELDEDENDENDESENGSDGSKPQKQDGMALSGGIDGDDGSREPSEHGSEGSRGSRSSRGSAVAYRQARAELASEKNQTGDLVADEADDDDVANGDADADAIDIDVEMAPLNGRRGDGDGNVAALLIDGDNDGGKTSEHATAAALSSQSLQSAALVGHGSVHSMTSATSSSLSATSRVRCLHSGDSFVCACGFRVPSRAPPIVQKNHPPCLNSAFSLLFLTLLSGLSPSLSYRSVVAAPLRSAFARPPIRSSHTPPCSISHWCCSSPSFMRPSTMRSSMAMCTLNWTRRPRRSTGRSTAA
jgi:hypothetical protein